MSMCSLRRPIRRRRRVVNGRERASSRAVGSILELENWEIPLPFARSLTIRRDEILYRFGALEADKRTANHSGSKGTVFPVGKRAKDAACLST